jgi:hypothetical protein
MPIKNEPCPEVQVTEEIKQYLDSRNKLGWNKYSATMDRSDLNPVEWCAHLIDELGDAMQYAWKLRKELEGMQPANPSHKRFFRAVNTVKHYNDLCIDQTYMYADEENEMHSAIICGFVTDPEDGDLIVVQLGYTWVAVSFDTLFEEFT